VVLVVVDCGEGGPGAGPGCAVHAVRTSNPRTDNPARRLIVSLSVPGQWYATVLGWLSLAVSWLSGPGQWSAPALGWLPVPVPG